MQARNKVPVAETWNVHDIYPDDAAFNVDRELYLNLVEAFITKYTDQLKTSSDFITALGDFELLEQKSSLLIHYAFLPQSTDITDSAAAQLLRATDELLSVNAAKLTFFDDALVNADVAILDAIATDAPKFASYIRHTKEKKAHQLSPDVEAALAQLSPSLYSAENTYGQVRSADLAYDPITVNGVEYPMSFVLYENRYQYSPDTDLRRAASKAFYDGLAKYQNTVASTYYNQVATEKRIATLRGFDSVIDYLLVGDEVDRSLFDRQIDGIMNWLAPVMRKYVNHIKEVRGLDKVTFADLQIDLDPDFNPKVTIEESKQLVSDAISTLGASYHDMIMPAYAERWVDFAQNAGKESGGFATKAFGIHPYILMTWTDEMADVFTLIHELGHNGHMILSEANNSILGDFPATYVSEAPSTFNELLLANSLQASADDARSKRAALVKMLTNTYYHNFVTHLLEAAFQREVYTLIDNGESFDAAKLNEIKRGVLEKFWGSDVEINNGAELTWMRQSHYYMGLYSYSYSASLTISTQAFLKVREEGQPAVDRWLELLKAGDQYTPVDLAAKAGVDITTDEPLKQTIKFLDETVDQIIAYTDELK
ncbi:oligoendopeptidase F [Periweissella cryptocerci]|uniref:Oligopeptidase F n=1 Tax=Periweissella cryptocerci TaxID=2506420 RepID=A0A4P6YV41_9LACO|nr:oligoendopeptidase F [Periweissella cryptocerci]QBO36640.1 oligoendopeptidase F [Periweissella cryptocerci]